MLATKPFAVEQVRAGQRLRSARVDAGQSLDCFSVEPLGRDSLGNHRRRARVDPKCYAFFKGFLDNFNNVDVLAPDRISDQAWQAMFNVAVGSSPYASYACVDTWLTDVRADLPKIDVPTLVLHGTDDRILPFSATAARLGDLIADVTVVPVEGGPHNIGWTHPEVVNKALLGFLAATTSAA